MFQASATTGYDHTAVLTLALDTTTKGGSVAVVRGDDTLAVVQGDAARTHGERLPGEIDRALREARVARAALELIAVASGPGAFTGLRIGLAAVQGVAMVTGIPVVGVSALDALARAAFADPGTDADVWAWIDAARGEVFAAQYAREQRASLAPSPRDVPIVASPSALAAALDAGIVAPITIIGDGAVRYGPEILQAAPRARIIDRPAALADTIARIGQVLAAEGQARPPHALQPLYVRRPDAELERSRSSVAAPPSSDRR